MTSQFGWGPGYGPGGRRHPHHHGAGVVPGSGGYGSGANGLPGVGGVQANGQGPQVAPTPPPDPGLLTLEAQNNLGSGLSSAVSGYRTGQIGYQTGYNQDGSLNSANPYSQAALLQESYKRSTAGTTNSYAGQGQLNSGAYGRMQNENARNLSIGSNQLQNQASNAYYNNNVTNAQNQITYGSGTVSPQLASIFKALGIPGY